MPVAEPLPIYAPVGNINRTDLTPNLTNQPADHNLFQGQLDILGSLYNAAAWEAFSTFVTLELRRGDGTHLAPTAPLAGDELGAYSFGAFTGPATVHSGNAVISATLTENQDGTHAGTRLSIGTTTPNPVTPSTYPGWSPDTQTERVRVTDFGSVITGQQVAATDAHTTPSPITFTTDTTQYYGLQTSGLHVYQNWNARTVGLGSFADIATPVMVEVTGTINNSTTSGGDKGWFVNVQGRLLYELAPNLGGSWVGFQTIMQYGNAHGFNVQLGPFLSFSDFHSIFADGFAMAWDHVANPYVRGASPPGPGISGAALGAQATPLTLTAWPNVAGTTVAVGGAGWDLGYWSSPVIFTKAGAQLNNFLVAEYVAAGVGYWGGVNAQADVGLYIQDSGLGLADPTGSAVNNAGTFTINAPPATLAFTSGVTIPAGPGYVGVYSSAFTFPGDTNQVGILHYTGTSASSGAGNLTGVTFYRAVNPAATVLNGYVLEFLQAPTLQQKVGIYIDPLVSAAANAGIVNASTMVDQPANSGASPLILTAPTKIPTSRTMVFVGTAGNNVSMNAKPFVDGVFDGQRVTVMMCDGGGTFSLTITTQGIVTQLFRNQCASFVWDSNQAGSANGGWGREL